MQVDLNLPAGMRSIYAGLSKFAHARNNGNIIKMVKFFNGNSIKMVVINVRFSP